MSKLLIRRLSSTSRTPILDQTMTLHPPMMKKCGRGVKEGKQAREVSAARAKPSSAGNQQSSNSETTTRGSSRKKAHHQASCRRKTPDDTLESQLDSAHWLWPLDIDSADNCAQTFIWTHDSRQGRVGAAPLGKPCKPTHNTAQHSTTQTWIPKRETGFRAAWRLQTDQKTPGRPPRATRPGEEAGRAISFSTWERLAGEFWSAHTFLSEHR